MKAEAMLEELERAAETLEVRVTYETLTADATLSGGLCKVKGQWRVILDRRASPSEKVSMLAQALARFDLERVFLSPEVREVVERSQAIRRAAEAREDE
jgi:hypothetical protein